VIASLSIGHEIGRALSFAVGMTWEILWALKTLLVSSGLGAASSSCSCAVPRGKARDVRRYIQYDPQPPNEARRPRTSSRLAGLATSRSSSTSA
jgi:hypothetical protein